MPFLLTQGSSPFVGIKEVTPIRELANYTKLAANQHEFAALFFALHQALDSHSASNFVVLLAHTKLLSFKGLYACSGEEDGTADRVFGLGPPQVDATMVSGARKQTLLTRKNPVKAGMPI